MTGQNRNYIKKEIGKFLADIWRIKGLSEQEFGLDHPITKKLSCMHGIPSPLLQENRKAKIDRHTGSTGERRSLNGIIVQCHSA